MNKPKYYFIFVIVSVLQIIGGLFQTAGSLPLFTLYQNIKDGGIRIESDNVYIEKVMPLSPAAEAQLIVGDIIVSANGAIISNPNDFTDIVYKNKGKSIDVVIKRNGEFNQAQLIPRVDNPPNEGPTGVVISNSKFQKEPLYLLIPKTLFQDISWDLFTAQKNEIAGPIGISRILFQREYFRPLIFTWGVSLIVLAIGLIKLKKWAMYGIFILIFIDVVQMIVYFPSISQFNTSLLLSIVSFFVSILFVYYLYLQRKFFD